LDIVRAGWVYRNPHPAYRSVVAAAATASWGAVETSIPRLVCAFRTGQAKMSPDGVVVLRSSGDGGATWETVRSPFGSDPEPGISLAGVHLGADPAGTLVLAAARMRIVAPEDPAWDDQATGIVDADTALCRAADGHWEKPITLDFRRHPDEWAIPCGPPLALGDGRWIFAMERHAMVRVPDWLRRYHAFAAISNDDGRTWTHDRATLNDPEERLAYYDQRMTSLPDGRLLTMAWVHDVVDDTTLTARAGYSADGGESWSEPFDTGIVGGPINPILLRDGRILAVYNRRTAPTGIRACLSEDGGRTWCLEDEIVIYDEARREISGRRVVDADRVDSSDGLWDTMWGWTFGTPTPVELPDGTVAVTFFATGFDGVTGIRCAVLRPGSP
jgi:hypothetical protein